MLIVCDVLNPDGSPHETNTRARLVELLTPDVIAEKPLYGFEQVRHTWLLLPLFTSHLASAISTGPALLCCACAASMKHRLINLLPPGCRSSGRLPEWQTMALIARSLADNLLSCRQPGMQGVGSGRAIQLV